MSNGSVKKRKRKIISSVALALVSGFGVLALVTAGVLAPLGVPANFGYALLGAGIGVGIGAGLGLIAESAVDNKAKTVFKSKDSKKELTNTHALINEQLLRAVSKDNSKISNQLMKKPSNIVKKSFTGAGAGNLSFFKNSSSLSRNNKSSKKSPDIKK